MLDKLKDLYNLRKQAQEMQGQLANQSVTGTSRNGQVKLTVNGNQELQNVSIDDSTELSKSSLEKSIKEAFSDAQAQLKTILMAQFKDLL